MNKEKFKEVMCNILLIMMEVFFILGFVVHIVERNLEGIIFMGVLLIMVKGLRAEMEKLDIIDAKVRK